jgi:hypothetical protein
MHGDAGRGNTFYRVVLALLARRESICRAGPPEPPDGNEKPRYFSGKPGRGFSVSGFAASNRKGTEECVYRGLLPSNSAACGAGFRERSMSDEWQLWAEYCEATGREAGWAREIGGLLARMRLLPCRLVLDVGCGTGRFAVGLGGFTSDVRALGAEERKQLWNKVREHHADGKPFVDALDVIIAEPEPTR